MSSPRLMINHNDDIGIWISNAGMPLIGHALLMKAVDPEFPNHINVNFFKPHNEKHRYFQNYDEIPLYYCKYNRIQDKKHYLHLFGMGEAAARIFIEECNLSDLQFPVRIVGIIMIVAKQSIENGYLPTSEFDWVQKQKVRIVIAGTGYSDTEENQIQQLLSPNLDMQIIVGPEIKHDTGFDQLYAHRLLEAFK